MHQHTFCGLSLAGMAGDGIAMIEMRIPHRVDLNRTSTIHPQTHSAITDSFNRCQFAVSDLQFIIGRGELDAVAYRKRTLLLSIDGYTLLAAWIVALLCVHPTVQR